MKVKTFKKPKWCKIHLSGDNLHRCCKCGGWEVGYQVGDGKFIHSLCFKCYKKLKSKLGDLAK